MRIHMGLGVAICVALLAGPVMADLDETITLYDSYGSSRGGEFLATYGNLDFEPVSLGESPGKFETFCVEKNETFHFNRSYYAEFNTAAENGGAGGPNPDPLSNETAYLYRQFITGQLDGYVYDTSGGAGGRRQSANALQNAIWYLEQEIGNAHAGLNATEKGLVDLFLADADAHKTDPIGTVGVLNLYQNANRTGFKQDQLVMQHVPAPGAAAMGVIGLGLIGWTRRRMA